MVALDDSDSLEPMTLVRHSTARVLLYKLPRVGGLEQACSRLRRPLQRPSVLAQAERLGYLTGLLCQQSSKKYPVVCDNHPRFTKRYNPGLARALSLGPQKTWPAGAGSCQPGTASSPASCLLPVPHLYVVPHVPYAVKRTITNAKGSSSTTTRNTTPFFHHGYLTLLFPFPLVFLAYLRCPLFSLIHV